MKKKQRIKNLLLAGFLTILLLGIVWYVLQPDTDTPVDPVNPSVETDSVTENGVTVRESGEYTHKEEVALYLHAFNHLPSNFITKAEAKKLGWSGGGLEKYKQGGAIGGDSYSNYEKTLPTKKGRQYYECDIDTVRASKRGAKRLVYSNDGLIYYTDDHYESFTLLYGEP